jgi:hypothetical protein
VNESDPLDRPATPEEIETVERLLKRALNVVPLPKARPVPKTSTELPAAKQGPVTAVDQTAMSKQIREGGLVPRSANGRESGTSIQLQRHRRGAEKSAPRRSCQRHELICPPCPFGL